MGEFVDQDGEFLPGAKARAQSDEILGHPAMHGVGQRRSRHPSAAALDEGFERLNVLGDRCHRTTS